MPPVKGIDLEHALNYLDFDRVGAEFIYNHYTACRLTHVPGSRPRLEQTASAVVAGCADAAQKVAHIAHFVARQVPWAGYYYRRTGNQLPSDRNATVEELLDSGYGWCNEQARVFCALTQVIGIPSRLVFVCSESRRYGHVVCEALLPTGWLTVDQSLEFSFIAEDGPVRACDIWRVSKRRLYFEPIYRAACAGLIEEVGAGRGFDMAEAADPLDGFALIGYHNYFI